MDIGLQAGGLTLQQSFEIEPLCCDTLRRDFAHEVVQCDITQKLVQSEKECHVMVATYPCTKYSPIADIHGVRTGESICFCIAATEPSLTVGLASRSDSPAGGLCGREHSGDEEVSGGHGGNDQAAGLLRTCCLPGKVFDLATAKERSLDHYWQPAKLCLARAGV
jgi:hypothetical protein